MKRHQSASLDELLRAWGSRTAPDAVCRRNLAASVMRTTRESLRAGTGVEAEPLQGPAMRLPRMPVWVALGATAAGLVLAVITWQRGEDRAAPEQVAQDRSLASPFSAKQVAARTLLFGELDALFAGTLRWVSMQADRMQFDVGTEPVRSGDAPVALRTVVSKLSPATQDWVPVWQADILLPPEDYVVLETSGTFAARLGLWVHRLPDGGHVVQADIANGGGASNSHLLHFRPGSAAVEMACLKTGEAHYRISQSLAILMEGSG